MSDLPKTGLAGQSNVIFSQSDDVGDNIDDTDNDVSLPVTDDTDTADDFSSPQPQPQPLQPQPTVSTPSSPIQQPSPMQSMVSSNQPISGPQKEVEPAPQVEPPTLEETMGEMELEPDLEQAGVEKVSETIEIPPDMRKMGVQPTGPTQPVSQIPPVKLPIPDELVEKGLHAQILSSLRWLAEWCIRKLKKAHIHLKNLGGRIVRERN